jgi:Ca2+-binding EF-hand superfamily protein
MGNKQNTNLQRELNDKEIDMLMANAGMSRNQVETWHNKFMTEFPGGYIDQKQFIELYKQTYSHGHPGKFAKFCFLAFDQDKNGRISFEE